MEATKHISAMLTMKRRQPHLAPAANRQREAMEATKHVSAMLTMKRRQPHLARLDGCPATQRRAFNKCNAAGLAAGGEVRTPRLHGFAIAFAGQPSSRGEVRLSPFH